MSVSYYGHIFAKCKGMWFGMDYRVHGVAGRASCEHIDSLYHLTGIKRQMGLLASYLRFRNTTFCSLALTPIVVSKFWYLYYWNRRHIPLNLFPEWNYVFMESTLCRLFWTFSFEYCCPVVGTATLSVFRTSQAQISAGDRLPCWLLWSSSIVPGKCC
jgi:hypothetical protein